MGTVGTVWGCQSQRAKDIGHNLQNFLMGLKTQRPAGATNCSYVVPPVVFSTNCSYVVPPLVFSTNCSYVVPRP